MSIKTPLQLYKYLLICVKKLPHEVQGYYQHHVRNGFINHADETDGERIEQIINRAIEDSEWILTKRTTGTISMHTLRYLLGRLSTYGFARSAMTLQSNQLLKDKFVEHKLTMERNDPSRMSFGGRKRTLPRLRDNNSSDISSIHSLSRTRNVRDAIISPYELGKANRQYKKVYPNRIYTQWYRRFVNVLPEDCKLDFQPFEEVQKIDEDIALQYFYGEDGHILDSFIQRDAVEKRRTALERFIKHKENEDKERNSAIEESQKGSRFRSIMKALKAREGADFGVSVTDKKVFQPIIQFLHKMQLKKRRKLHIVVLKPNSKWKILHTSSVLTRLNIMYRILMVEVAQARFRKIIRLVACAMRFINVVRIISGSTKQVLKEIENFKEMQRDTSNKKSMHGSKKMFDYTKYTFKEMHIPLCTQMTLTKPWFMRGEREIDEVLEVLQVYKSFVQYPPLFQRRLARMAWYIEIEANKYIIRERHIACDFYLLLKGKAKEMRLVGDPYYLGNGEMKLIRYIKKSEAFGDESMSDPECQRDYSIISCEPCVLLAISVYDYNKMLHTKKDNEIAPEHIIFISHLKLFEGFPRRKLLEEGDENITIHYFRSAIHHNVYRSLWYPKSENLQLCVRHHTFINMKNIKCEQHSQEDSVTKSVLGKKKEQQNISKIIDMNWLKRELKIQKQKHAVMIGIHRNVIEAEILDLQIKAKEILRTLPKAVRTTFSMENFLKVLGRAESSNPPDAMNILKANRSSMHAVLESIGLEQWSALAGTQQFQEMSSSSHLLAQHQYSLHSFTSLNLPTESDTNLGHHKRDSQEYVYVDNSVAASPSNVSTGDDYLELKDENSTIFSDINLLLETNIEEVHSKHSKKKDSNKSQRLSLGAISERSSENIPPASHSRKYLPRSKVPPVHQKDTRISFTIKNREDPRLFSRWKHVRYMSRGDNVGQEWLDFNNGPYEEPRETWSMVSNGCEVIMIKKSFLLKYMRKDW